MWNSLEVTKLIVALLGPLTIAATAAITAIFVNRRLKNIEHIQWKNRRIVDKRIEIYEGIAPLLNDIYCYLAWVGVWQMRKPTDIIDAKRQLDRRMHINRYILDDAVFAAYDAFMGLAFKTFNAPGEDAKIRTTLTDPLGDRRNGRFFAWDPAWETMFAPDKAAPKDEVKAAYQELLLRFKQSIGLN